MGNIVNKPLYVVYYFYKRVGLILFYISFIRKNLFDITKKKDHQTTNLSGNADKKLILN